MLLLACWFPSRRQSVCAHSTLPSRHIVNRAAALSACSQPRPVRLFSQAVFAALAALCLYALAGVALQAQTAHPGGVVILGSGFSTPTGVTVDGSGNVYVADNGNSAVKKIVAVNGRIPFVPVINTLGSGFGNPFTVAVNASGNVLVTDYGNHLVQEIEAAGGYTTVRTLDSDVSFIFGTAYDAHGDAFFTDYGRNKVEELLAVNGIVPNDPKILSLGGGFNIPAGLAVDASGNVFVGDQNNNEVKEILASTGYTETITIASGFSTPDGVAVDANENVYVANDGGNTVVELLAVNGVLPPTPTKVTLGSGFTQPFDVAVDGSGNVYVADRGNNAVKEIELPSANFGQVPVGTTIGSFPIAFTFDTGGTLGSYSVVTLGDVLVDFKDAGSGTCAANTIYATGATCTVNVNFGPTAPGPRYGAVELFSTTGALLATFPLQGVGTGPQVNFAVTKSGVSLPSELISVGFGGGFSGPGGAAMDASGNIFVADSYNNAVKEIVAAGGWTTVNVLNSSFLFPNGVALDGGGNVYVADTLNNAVKEIVAGGGYVTVNTLGSGFANPYGVAVDGLGDVFVADYSNGAVKEMVAVGGKIPSSPTILTLASSLNGPDGVAVDGNGNVFVAVYGDGTVLEIEAVNGSVPEFPVINTIGTGFSGPANLSLDGIGDVFVSDTGNGRVVELLAAGGYATGRVLDTSFTAPEATAVWGNGDVVVADAGTNAVTLLDYADPPVLTFASTPVGLKSSDSPQTVTVSNDGNAALVFPVPGSGTNPSIPTNFVRDASSTCVQTTPASSKAFSLAGGTSCTMAFDFEPTTIGEFSPNAVLTDNNLNVSNVTQSIELSGVGSNISPTLTSPSASPVSGSTLFQWNPGSGWAQFDLKIGTGSPGAHNIYDSGYVASSVTSETVVIPSNGVTLYVSLYYRVANGTWNYKGYTFTEATTPPPPALTPPALISPSASPISGSTKFQWSLGTGWAQFDLKIGIDGPGAHDLYDSGYVANSVTSETVNVPSDGKTLYVSLYYRVTNGTWNYKGYTFTEAQ